MKNLFALIRQKWRSVTYMQASLALLIPEVLAFVYLFVRSVMTGGGLTAWEGGIGVLAMLCALAGIIIPLYGHFIVRIDGRKSWKIPFFAHLGVFLLWIVFYCAGL